MNGELMLTRQGHGVMSKLLTSLTAAAVLVAPAHAADWRDQGADVRRGAFIGAQVKISFGSKTRSQPHAELAIAPTQSRISSDGMIRTRIGQGVALNLADLSKPRLTIAGVPADTAFGLRRQGQVKAEQKLGISDGVWIGIGVGVAAAALYALYLYNEAEKNTE